MTFSLRTLIIWVAAIAASLALALVAYRIIGWIGVLILGLLICFCSFQAGMDDAAPIGHGQATGLFASSLADPARSTNAERAERSAQARATAKALVVGKVIGAAMALAGLVGFWLVQMPG